MRRFVSAFIGLCVTSGAVLAQSVPSGINFGARWTTKQWQDAFASKQDVLGFSPIGPSGARFTGTLYAFPSQTTGAGFNLGVGSDPSNPIPGDIWVTSSGIFAYANGQILNLGSGGGGGGGWNGALPAPCTGSCSPGGVLYIPDSAHIAASPTLAANRLMVGGGSGRPPTTFVPSTGDVSFNYPQFIVNSINGVTPGPLYGATAVNLATQTTGNLPFNQLDSGTNADSLHCLSGAPVSGAAWVPCDGSTGYAFPSNPSGTTSTSFVMMGLGFQIASRKGGNVAIAISGSVSNSGAGTCVYAVYYGTGTPPTNGVSVPTGAVGLNVPIPTPAISVLSANGVGCFTPIGTVCWIDIAIKAVGSGTCTASNLTLSAIEN